VFVDERLAAEDEIAFNAGTFDDAIAMTFVDFVALAHPTIGRFARPRQRLL
jgi:prolyl-tRNA editing enzyme YbaK/EbsC (Cys-tRNA(Pro) deacylase)